MKKLTISIKSPSEALENFKTIFKATRQRKKIQPQYEISFDNKKDFDRFVRNIFILSQILAFKPKSIYELAKLANLDVANLNKILNFFEEIGAVRVEQKIYHGRAVKKPIVDYSKIEFNLKAA